MSDTRGPVWCQTLRYVFVSDTRLVAAEPRDVRFPAVDDCSESVAAGERFGVAEERLLLGKVTGAGDPL